MPSDTSRDFRWLLGESAARLLQQAAQGLAEHQNALTIVKRLRKTTTPARAAIVLEQAQLRIRGRVKFRLADQMFFTRRGLEQSTSESLARYKADRFASCDRVADVCCGIGGDLIGLSGRDGASATVGIDIDETTSRFASRNVAANQLNHQGDAWVQQLSFEKLNLNGFQGLHLDPDRRVKRRGVRGNHFQPSLPDVLNRISADQLVSIKVAPATPSESDWPQAMQREWIGDRRECKQQVLWLGERTANDREVTATMVDGEQSIVSFSAGEAERDQSVAAQDAVGEFVYEPHPTILAARLTNPFARHLGLTRISAALPYLTGSTSSGPWFDFRF